MGILKEIVSKKKERLKDAKALIPTRELRTKIGNIEKTRDFKTAIKRSPDEKIKLIAEIKKASPSRGIIRKDFDHLSLARIYREKAVNAVSVLTEEDFFYGNLKFLSEVRKVLTKPILRKDFIFDEYQIYESKAKGADAILLIASMLDENQSVEFLHLAKEIGLSVVFEVHDFKELEMVLHINAEVLGINNRDLKTLGINLNTTFELKKEIPFDKIVVSESGIKTREDVRRLENAGIDSILVGTAFMEAEDIGKKIDEFMGRAE